MRVARILVGLVLVCAVIYGLMRYWSEYPEVSCNPIPPPQISANGRFVVYSTESGVCIYDHVSSRMSTIRPLGRHYWYMYSAISGNGEWIAFSAIVRNPHIKPTFQICLYEVATGKSSVLKIQGFLVDDRPLALSNDGRYYRVCIICQRYWVADAHLRSCH